MDKVDWKLEWWFEMAKTFSRKRPSNDKPQSDDLDWEKLEKTATAPLKPLNFKVPGDFHREFKAFAAMQGMSMVELLREGFELSKQKRKG